MHLGEYLFFLLPAVFPAVVAAGEPQNASPRIVLVLHGGAGVLSRESVTPELEKQYREALERALRAGHAILRNGGASLDAVEVGIKVLEDSPLFNAGKGAVFTHDGRNELDASIMDGRTRRAGAVAGVTTVKNPISAARAVMERSPHVLLTGKGADTFAAKMGLEIVDPAYFRTEKRWQQLQDALQKERAGKFGTVGAVALDQKGNLAAGTSTGGMTNKRYGRVGDSPIIGAGTYADNATCAVSATGHGEYFLRYVVAHDISALIAYKGLSVEQAAGEVIHKKLKAAGGEGGVIALDAKGNFALPFNTEGMYRGYITTDGVPHVFVYEK